MHLIVLFLGLLNHKGTPPYSTDERPVKLLLKGKNKSQIGSKASWKSQAIALVSFKKTTEMFLNI